MPRAATAFVEFEGDFSKVGRGVGSQARSMEGSFNSSFKRIAAFATGALAGVGVGKFLKDAFSEASESVKVGRQTAAVIKSTGGAAHVTAGQVDELSNSLAAKAGVDDELIASGENVLLTFTNVRNEVGKGNDIFDQGTTAALNMSAALGTDLQGSVIQVGKALNDPIKGVTALQRVGVSFTKSQKDQIKTLVESGHTLDAQKLILRELSKEFGGAAAAAASPSQKLGVAFKNIEESFGLLFLPLLNRVASFLTTTVAPALEHVVPVLHELAQAAIIAFEVGFGSGSIKGITGWLGVFSKVGRFLRAFIDFVKGNVAGAGVEIATIFGISEDDPRVAGFIRTFASVRKVLVSVAQFLARNWKSILIGAAAALLIFTAPIVAVVVGLFLLYRRFSIVREGVARFVEFFKRNWPAIQSVGVAVIGVLIGAVKLLIPTLINLGRGLAAVIGFLREHQDVAAALAAVIGTLVAAFVTMFIVNKIKDAIAAFRAAMLALNSSFLANPIVLVVVALVALGAAIFLAYKHFGPFHRAVDAAWQILQSLFHWVQRNWPLLLAILTGPIGLAALFIIRHWSAISDGAHTAFDAIVGFFRQLPGRILGFAGSVGRAALRIGSAILHGIINGITGAVSFVVGIGRSIANAAIGFVNRIIDNINDALEFKISLPFGKHFSLNPPDIPHIPTLHSGGIFEAPGGEGLALLKSGEGVFTPEQMRAIGAAATGRPFALGPITTKVDGTGRLAALLQELFDEHDRELEHALAAGALVGAA